MKDIYELFNEMNIDESEFEEMEVTELEKARVKKVLKKSLGKKTKKNNWTWKKSVLASSILIGLSTTMVGFTIPTYASNIPIIGNIFRFFDTDSDGLYGNYKEFSIGMNISQESNGIHMTINDAIFDGKTVSLTYSIESEIDLGENPHIIGPINVKGTAGGTGGSQISRVDDNHYVGLITNSVVNHREEGFANIKWNIKTIINQDTGEEIKGNWNFGLTLEATDSQDLLIGQSAEQDGVKVSIEKLSVTPMSFIVYYNQEVSETVRNQWHGVDVELEIKDDLGNIYSGQGNGGSGDSYDMNWSATFEKLEQNATKLILTPRVTLRSYNSDNHGEGELTENGVKEISIPEKSGIGTKDYILEDIIIELKK
jgi:hypothetical protein